VLEWQLNQEHDFQVEGMTHNKPKARTKQTYMCMIAIINEQFVQFPLPPSHVDRLLKYITNNARVRQYFTDIGEIDENTFTVIHPIIGVHLYIKEKNAREGLQIITKKSTFSQLFTEQIDDQVSGGIFTISQRAKEYLGKYNLIDPQTVTKPIAKVCTNKPPPLNSEKNISVCYVNSSLIY